VKTQTWHDDGTSVAIVALVVYVLKIERRIDSSPKVKGVVHLSIVEPPVSSSHHPNFALDTTQFMRFQGCKWAGFKQ